MIALMPTRSRMRIQRWFGKTSFQLGRPGALSRQCRFCLRPAPLRLMQNPARDHGPMMSRHLACPLRYDLHDPLVRGQWQSIAPAYALRAEGGRLTPVCEDVRVLEALALFGGVKRQRLLERGPSEGCRSAALYSTGAGGIGAAGRPKRAYHHRRPCPVGARSRWTRRDCARATGCPVAPTAGGALADSGLWRPLSARIGH